jgi:hypothetical protein
MAVNGSSKKNRNNGVPADDSRPKRASVPSSKKKQELEEAHIKVATKMAAKAKAATHKAVASKESTLQDSPSISEAGSEDEADVHAENAKVSTAGAKTSEFSSSLLPLLHAEGDGV